MISERRHLALFTYGFAGSGAQWRMVNLARCFAERGYRVDLLVVRTHGPLIQELSPAVRLVALGPWWERLRGLEKTQGHWWLSGLSGLRRYLRDEQPDALLSTSYFSNVVALWARRLARVPTRTVIRVSNHLSHSLTHAPTFGRTLQLWCARRFYPWADALIAVSHGVAEDVAHVTGIPTRKIIAIDNPVLTESITAKLSVPLDHPWFAPGSPPVLLSAGRLARQKDFPTLLKAFSHVRSAGPLRLMILGEGRKRTMLESLAYRLGIAKDVALPGFVINPFPYMGRAAAFVLSSAWEGCPGVLIEAMACGCPVVSTDCPSGPAEILQNGRYGPLVRVGDDQGLATALAAVLAERPPAERLRERAALFSVARVAEQYLDVLTGAAAVLAPKVG
ncbi:MAG: glycosyltransferase [Candidatus Binatia bacterium]